MSSNHLPTSGVTLLNLDGPRVLTRANHLRANLRARWQACFGIFACSILIVVGGVLVETENWRVVGIPFAMCVALTLLLRHFDEVLAVTLPNRVFHSASRQAIADRDDAVVLPDDPDAVFAEVVSPRSPANADDTGFLRVDRERGRLLFEGDRERWVIPTDAVQSCRVDEEPTAPPNRRVLLRLDLPEPPGDVRLAFPQVYRRHGDPARMVATHLGHPPTDTSVDRPAYRPSGRVDRWAFLLLALLTIGLAFAIGTLAGLMTNAVFFLPLLAPLLLCVPSVSVLWLAVSIGRCRNPTVAGLWGLLAGPAFLLGFHQPDLTRLDALPDRVWRHLCEDRRRLDGSPRFTLNVLILVAETLLISGLHAYVGQKRARQCFDEATGQWAQIHVLRCQAGVESALLDALRRRDLSALSAALEPAYELPLTHVELQVEIVPDSGVSRAWLTVTALVRHPGTGFLHRRILVRQCELEPAEASVILDARRVRPPELPRSEAPRFGVTLLTPEAGPRVTAGWRGTLAVAAGLLEIAPVVGGAGVVAFVTLLFTLAESGWLRSARESGLLFWLTIAGGFAFVAMIGGVAYLVHRVGDLPNRVHRWASRRAIAERADAVVRPDDPDARFVRIVPRFGWGLPLIVDAGEVGFLRIDEERGLLLFEGDRERWVIPADALLPTEIDISLTGAEYLVLRANLGEVWEAPIALGRGHDHADLAEVVARLIRQGTRVDREGALPPTA